MSRPLLRSSAIEARATRRRPLQRAQHAVGVGAHGGGEPRVALGALGAAGLELSEDLRPGAHHGVALLAGVLVVKTCVSIWEAK